ncbi:MAG: acyclic terpene utilization AtuA family protein [Janthinobacterium lividum]
MVREPAVVQEGAEVIVTGRVTDSALALGPLMAQFGRNAEDEDALAHGVLALAGTTP